MNIKIGQMTQAERTHITSAEITTFFIGSVLNGGVADADYAPLYPYGHGLSY
ncbi:hypothetical protein [Agaribacter marinus]|uniref:Uncharacterized protein n=1 Tax=Agaribacter marinus TaxID=1431249 RepID=A0AA37SXP0_9ALTE|nr:hypothetical protein [Agaribacter marinus]GLR71818.1 hypothetical protein GCM10007852_27260 [Agaribacter marinus]